MMGSASVLASASVGGCRRLVGCDEKGACDQGGRILQVARGAPTLKHALRRTCAEGGRLVAPHLRRGQEVVENDIRPPTALLASDSQRAEVLLIVLVDQKEEGALGR
eukprot:scaffold6380_cov121-Isochrysis_galbana.AAC.4